MYSAHYEARLTTFSWDQGNGGTGETFDWELVPPVRRPFFLAGGIGPENIRSAIATLHPWAVDLSSSLETDGKKRSGEDPADCPDVEADQYAGGIQKRA